MTAAILDLVELYCNTFNANFQPLASNRGSSAPLQEAGLVNNVLAFNVHAAHRIPITWATRYTHTHTPQPSVVPVMVVIFGLYNMLIASKRTLQTVYLVLL